MSVPPGLPLQLNGPIQDLFATTASRVLVTVLAVGFLVVAGLLLRAGGRPLEARFHHDDVEAIRAVAFSVLAAATGWFLVIVWQAADSVASRFERFQVGPQTGALALVAVLTLIVAYTLTRVSKGLLEDRDGDVMTAHRREVLHHVIQIAVYALAGLFVLALAGVKPGQLLVGAGAAGLVVGLAARQTLSSVFAGIVLLFARPFEVGDWVVVADAEGIVTDINLFNTQLRTFDEEYVVIPNEEVTAENVVNRSREGKLRITVDVGVDYDTDVSRAAEIARTAMVECEVDPMLAEPQPEVVGKRFGDSAVVLGCRFWIDDPTAPRMWETRTAVIRAIKDAFEDEGVKIPFPQRELAGREETGGLRLAGGAGESVTASERRKDETEDVTGEEPTPDAND